MDRNRLLQPIILLLSAVASASAPDPKVGDCVSKPCGTINVTYPFWISPQQPSYCGFPQFELKCSDNIPVLGDGYHVKNIDYQTQTLLVADPQLSQSPCPPLPTHNSTSYFPPFTVSTTNMQLVFFNNCAGPPLPAEDPYAPFCDQEGSFSYLVDSYGDLERLRPVIPCSSVVVPVLGFAGATPSNYSKLLSGGFLLNWTVADCSECKESGGECRYNIDANSFMCICSDRMHSKSCEKKSHTKTIEIGVGLLGIFLIFLVFCIYFYHAKLSQKRVKVLINKPKSPQSVESFLENYESFAPKRYKYSEVKKMTKSFSDKLGHGGFGVVYKGELRDGRLVAVKILSGSKGNGEEFLNEVASIGRTSHVNIVNLLGFCYEGSKRALIYEFMPNGSLEKFIYLERGETVPLGWEVLYKISIGIARGLEYLHRGCNTRIVHFDIKPHNILLDQDFCPKISDFGLAKLFPSAESRISFFGARGTAGFIAPEVFSRNFGCISSKSDVYSYGMMILEMVGGRKNVNATAANTSEIYFPHWIYEHMDQDGDLNICGVTNETIGTAKKMILVGLWCIQTLPENRPSIGRVLEMLEGSMEDMQLPPKPYLSSPSRSMGSPIVTIS